MATLKNSLEKQFSHFCKTKYAGTPCAVQRWWPWTFVLENRGPLFIQSLTTALLHPAEVGDNWGVPQG